MKKALVTLDINYNQEITNLTYPYMRKYAEKIGADFVIMNERKFPHLSCNMEKFQLYEISANYDWTIFIDADALIHPNCPDVTEIYKKDCVIELLLPYFNNDKQLLLKTIQLVDHRIKKVGLIKRLYLRGKLFFCLPNSNTKTS